METKPDHSGHGEAPFALTPPPAELAGPNEGAASAHGAVEPVPAGQGSLFTTIIYPIPYQGELHPGCFDSEDDDPFNKKRG